MTFFTKAGNILRQTVSKHVNSDIYGFNPSVFQMIRCMSTSKVFVGGLSYTTDDMSLKEAFRKYGDVIEARVIMDRDSGRSRGFGFVTYTSGEEASAAIQALDGQDLHGRRVKVNYANERPQTGGFGGGYGGGNFGGSGGYGGADNYGGSNYGNYGGGGGGYGVNYGGGNNDSFGGGNYAHGGTYGSAGVAGGNSYGSGGSGDSYGGGSYTLGSTCASGTGSSGNYGGSNQSLGAAGVGSDNYVGGGAGALNRFGSGGFDGSTGLSGNGEQFGSSDSSSMAGQDDPIDENYRVEDGGDEPDNDFTNRKA